MTTTPLWITYLSGLLTPTIAIFGLLIAYRQWRLAQNKLKFDLFDRRLIVYEAARTLLSSIMTSGKAKNEVVFKFMDSTRETKWLFNESIAEYIDKELYHKALDLQTLASMLEGVPVGEERTKNVVAQGEIKKWFMKQYEVLDEKFSPFLKLDHF